MQSKIINLGDISYKREITPRVLYPYYKLNKITGGGEIGGIVEIFGKTNSGKSSIITHFITNWVRNGEKVVAMLGEHTIQKAQQILYKQVTTFNPETWETVSLMQDGKDTGIRETFISKEDEEKARQLFDGNLFLYDTSNGFSLEQILAGFEEGYKLGCRVAVLDNQMMVDIKNLNAEMSEQRDNTEILRQWAKEHNMVVYIVMHARKTESRNTIRLSENDIMGSSNIANKATTIMSVTRTNTLNPNTPEYKDYAKLLELNDIDITQTDSIIEIVKEKNGKGVGFVPLKWYESTKTYREVYNPKKSDEDTQTVLFTKQDSVQSTPSIGEIDINDPLFGLDGELPF